MNFWLRISSILTLVALALIIWPLFEPTLIPIMVAMSVGQAIGTAAFAAFGFVVFRDIRRKYVSRKSLERIDPKDLPKIVGGHEPTAGDQP